MKLAFLILLGGVLVFASGCAFMNDEDRDFYGKGWVKPSELDTPMPHHPINDPSHPQESTAPTRTAAAPVEPQPEWLIPEQGTQ